MASLDQPDNARMAQLRAALERELAPEEAVLWHGGEAEAAKDQVLKMKKADRDALVKFVESL